MNLRAFSDGHRIWIEDVDEPRDDVGRQIHCRFRTPPAGPKGMPKRAEKRLLDVARVMADAVNRAYSGRENGNGQ